MSGLAALRYAQSLLELATEKTALDAVAADWNRLLLAYQGDPSFARKLSDARLSAAEKKALVGGALGAEKGLVKNTVSVLIDRRREGDILPCALAFFEMLERAQGILRVEVETAQPLAADAEKNLVAGLEKATRKKVILSTVVKPELLGGIRLVIDSRLIDGSVKRRLETLAGRLKAAV